MTGSASKRDVRAGAPADAIDDGYRTISRLEQRPLLDVEFQVTKWIRVRSRIRHARRIKLEIPDRLRHGHFVCVLHGEKGCVQLSYQSAAADERHAESDAFLVGKANHLDAVRQSRPVKRLNQRESHDHPENSVEGAGVRHGVQMGADEQASRIFGHAGIDAAQVAGWINPDVHAGRRHPDAHHAVHLAHAVG